MVCSQTFLVLGKERQEEFWDSMGYIVNSVPAWATVGDFIPKMLGMPGVVVYSPFISTLGEAEAARPL